MGTFKISSDFPQVGQRDAGSVVTEVTDRLKGLLKEYLSALLDGLKPGEVQTFLTNDLVDKAFRIQDNVKEEIDMNAFITTYNTIKASGLAASDVKQSMNLEEMMLADEAATLLVTFVKGDGRMLDMNDERLQYLRTTCVVALLRLRCSLDREDVKVIRELILEAQDVLDHVEAALRVFVDTEIVLSS